MILWWQYDGDTDIMMTICWWWWRDVVAFIIDATNKAIGGGHLVWTPPMINCVMMMMMMMVMMMMMMMARMRMPNTYYHLHFFAPFSTRNWKQNAGILWSSWRRGWVISMEFPSPTENYHLPSESQYQSSYLDLAVWHYIFANREATMLSISSVLICNDAFSFELDWAGVDFG